MGSPQKQSPDGATAAASAAGDGVKKSAKIWWTLTDEAPALATHAFLPVVRRFLRPCGIQVEAVDISLASRILAAFPDNLTPQQRRPDALAQLGHLARTSPRTNIIKLPNVSASVPQLIAAVAELKTKGYDLPPFPTSNTDPVDGDTADERAAVAARYGKVLGSAVNPVLREGNSDRRVAPPVKEYARQHPHALAEWSADCKTHVASMDGGGDFYSSEQTRVCPEACRLRIELHAEDGVVHVLRECVDVEGGDVVDAAALSVAALREFVEQQLAAAAADGVMVSLHLKATMMKVSDPVIFGHVVAVFFKVGQRRLTTGCPQADPACFQRLKLKHDKLLPNFAFNFNLRPSIKEAFEKHAAVLASVGRASH